MRDIQYNISHLPRTYNPTTLYYFYTGISHNYTREEYRRAVHDLSVFRVPDDLGFDAFKGALAEAFFTHPLIKGLTGEIEKEGALYYGRVKGWIKSNCSDLPGPRRHELTKTILNLYKWFEELGGGRFQVDRPNLGQRISVIS